MHKSGSGRTGDLAVPIKQKTGVGGAMFDATGKRTSSMEELEQMLRKVEKKFRCGEPIFREAHQFRERTGMLFEMPDYDWFSQVYADPNFRNALDLSEREPDLHSAYMAWTVHKLRKVSDTSNWFRLSEGLTYALLATDLKGALIGDLKLPMDAFYIEIPPKVFYLDDKETGWHEVRSITVVRGRITEAVLAAARSIGDPTAEVTPLGERLLIDAYGEPNQNSENAFDDTWLFKSYVIEDESVNIEDALERSSIDSVLQRSGGYREKNLNRGRLGDKILDGIQIRSFFLRFVLNFCIYLGSDKPTVESLHEKEIAALHGGKKFKNLRKNVQQKIRDLQNDRVFLVGTDIKVDNELKELVRTEGSGGSSLAYRTLVRGHWRDQAWGPKHTLRRDKWIKPHVRGKDLPTPVVGHTYEVK